MEINQNELNSMATLSEMICFIMVTATGIFQKKSKQGWLRTHFLEKKQKFQIPLVTLGNFNILILLLAFLDKAKLSPWKFQKNVLYPLEIPKPKTNTHRNST